MGNHQPSTQLILDNNLDGKLEDIFKMVFMPEEKDILETIRKHVKDYPEALSFYVYHCVFYVNNIEYQETNITPLTLAVKYARRSSIAIINLLIELNANTDNLLYIACMYSGTTSTVEAAKALLDGGVNIHGENSKLSPIIYTCLYLDKSSSVDTLVMLIKHNVDTVDATNIDGRSVIDILNGKPSTTPIIVARRLVRKKLDERTSSEMTRLNLLN